MPQEAFIRGDGNKLQYSPLGIFLIISGMYYILLGGLVIGDQCVFCYNQKCLFMSFVVQVVAAAVQTIFVITELILVYASKQVTRNTHCGGFFDEASAFEMVPDMSHVAVCFFGFLVGQLTLILMNRGQSKVMTLTEQQKKTEKQKKLEATLPSVRGNARDIDPVLLNQFAAIEALAEDDD